MVEGEVGPSRTGPPGIQEAFRVKEMSEWAGRVREMPEWAGRVREMPEWATQGTFASRVVENKRYRISLHIEHSVFFYY